MFYSCDILVKFAFRTRLYKVFEAGYGMLFCKIDSMIKNDILVTHLSL